MVGSEWDHIFPYPNYFNVPRISTTVQKYFQAQRNLKCQESISPDFFSSSSKSFLLFTSLKLKKFQVKATKLGSGNSWEQATIKQSLSIYRDQETPLRHSWQMSWCVKFCFSLTYSLQKVSWLLGCYIIWLNLPLYLYEHVFAIILYIVRCICDIIYNTYLYHSVVNCFFFIWRIIKILTFIRAL